MHSAQHSPEVQALASNTVLSARAFEAGKQGYVAWAEHARHVEFDRDEDAVWHAACAWSLEHVDLCLVTSSDNPVSADTLKRICDVWLKFLAGWCCAADADGCDPSTWGYSWQGKRKGWSR